MESKHWNVEIPHSDTGFYVTDADQKNQNPLICWVCDSGPGTEGENNAKLISAAPSMLAALEAAIKVIPTDAMIYSGGDHGERIYPADIVRAAIAKARGE